MRCFSYQAKIVAKEYKMDELIECLRSLLPGFRKEKGGYKLAVSGCKTPSGAPSAQ